MLRLPLQMRTPPPSTQFRYQTLQVVSRECGHEDPVVRCTFRSDTPTALRAPLHTQLSSPSSRLLFL